MAHQRDAADTRRMNWVARETFDVLVSAAAFSPVLNDMDDEFSSEGASIVSTRAVDRFPPVFEPHLSPM